MMMKNNLRLSLILICLLSTLPVDAFFFRSNKGPIDPRLVGTWEGETVQQDGTLKQWTQIRERDGRFIIHFTYLEDGQVVGVEVSEGSWWMSDGRFCEISDGLTGQHFEYKVTWLSETCIEMSSVKRNEAGDEYDGYTFTECLIQKSFEE